jgi:predicted DNA-binding transcriptional regulator YafY
MSRSGRLLELAYLLNGRKALSVREIAERLQTSVRTVYRDLAELEAHKIPLETGTGRWRLAEGAVLPPVTLSSAERALLRLALSNRALRRQPGLRRALDSIRAKLAGPLDPGASREPVLELATVDRTGTVPEPLFDALRCGAAERRTCEVSYDSLSGRGRSRRRLDPYRIFLRGQAWYVAAFCHERRDVRIFRLDRFDEVELLDERFEPHPGFDLDAYLADAWEIFRGEAMHEVAAVFDPALRALIARGQHHPSERVTILPDGSCEYRAKVRNLDEIARWFVTFGGGVEILEPPELVETVCYLALGVLAAHDLLPEPPPRVEEPESAESVESLPGPVGDSPVPPPKTAREREACRDLTRRRRRIRRTGAG